MTALADYALAGPAERFSARTLPELERALVRATSGLGEGLAWVESATGQAVGLDGRGGRRWRPLLAIAGAQAAGVRVAGGYVMDVAVAIELTHTASLVLDDLPCMDDSSTRRGRAATHRLVGTAGAILVAVGLLGRSAELLGDAGGNGAWLAAEWGRVVGLNGMAGGQAVDVAQSGAARAAARRLFRRKTTALAEYAASAGAAAGGASAQAVAALAAFGRDVGWAYQLADDMEDLAEDGAVGKLAGGRTPQRQAARLLRRAGRHLTQCPDISREGQELLEDLARGLVPVECAH